MTTRTNGPDGKTSDLIKRMDQQQDNQDALTEANMKFQARQAENSTKAAMADAFAKSSKSLAEKQAGNA